MKQTFDKVFLFFFLAMTSGAVRRVLGGHGALQAGGSNSTAISGGNSDPLLLMFTVLLTSAAILGGFLKLRRIRTVLFSMAAIPALYLFAAMSILWTAGAIETVRACAYLMIYLVAAAYIAAELRPAELVRCTATSMVVLGLLSIPAQFTLPANGDFAPGWTGVFPQKNDLGAAMAIGVAALAAAGRKWTLSRIGALAVCVALLVLSQSFTAVVTAAIALIGVFYARSSGQIRMVLLVSLAGAAMIFAFTVSSLGDFFTSTTGKDLTFTGRTEIWSMVAAKILERPVLGYGYGAFWATQADSINQFSVWKPGQSHNGYLDICLNLGVSGLLLVLFLIAESLRRARRLRSEYRSRAGVWLLMVVLMLLVRNFAEASFLDLSLTWSTMLMAVFSARKAEYLAMTTAVTRRHRDRAIEILPPAAVLP
ncbi:O-antigen ligase family protein [Terriglobus roseus]|uniref:O-antigen ligase n=1 Tax=Terriglobus roseus TaxID=392734 RepID=A0A1H4J196_9BACT|nr:O-antigen ligase family protein [Terriglobus roseus]SEB39332.1 O-antigen ligase [Terriglobus roseus]